MEERSSKEENDEEDIVVWESDLPVDRGYAWVIVFAASMILFLVLGTLKCFGVFYVELARKFNVSSRELQSIQSLTGFFYLGLGPVASVLTMRFSNRSVIFVGGLFCGTGYLLTAFAPSIELFYLTYGCLLGFGYGFSFNPTIVCFVHYFNKKRALANGIIMAGGGFGSVVFPYLMRYLIDVMSLQGCMMIFSGLLYNICVFACLLRPHQNYPVKKKVKRKVDLKSLRSRTSIDQHSTLLLDAADLIHGDNKSCASLDDAKSQNSFVSEGEILLKRANRRSNKSRGSKMANASIISLKSFNPSLCTNPENMTKSLCSESQLSVDVISKGEKQMTASVISLKSFDPSLCSNIDALGKSIYSDDQQLSHLMDSLEYENKQVNASVISLKSFDPSVCSNIDTMGKSIYSDDQQSIGVISFGDTNRKQSLGVVSLDDSLSRESYGKIACITESQTEETSDENKSKLNESLGNNSELELLDIESKETEYQNIDQRTVTKPYDQRKKRHRSEGANSFKSLITSVKHRVEEDHKPNNVSETCSLKAEKECLLKNVARLRKEDIASVISLKSFDPSLCASFGVLAGISMQSIPQDNEIPELLTESMESPKAEPFNPCAVLKKLLFSMNWSLFKDPIFIMFLFFAFSECLGYLSLFNILPPYCEEIGASASEGALIISILSLSEFFGRFFFGWLSHMCQNFQLGIYFVCCLLMGIGIILTPETKTFLHLAILCGVYGIFIGGYNGVLFHTFVNGLGLAKFTQAWGFIAFAASLSLLLNPVESGYIKDTTDSWAYAFRINGGIALLGCTTLLVVAFLQRKKPQQTNNIEMEVDTSVEL